MIHPSYTELLNIINDNRQEGEPEIDSRYSLVIASAKRARQLIEGQDALSYATVDKPLSIAVKEISEKKVRITKEGEDDFKHVKGANMGGMSFEDSEAPETEDAE